MFRIEWRISFFITICQIFVSRKRELTVVLKYIAHSTFLTSQITHGLITRNVFSINYFYSFFVTFLLPSLSRLNLKNCYFCHLSAQTWLLVESALFASSLPHLFYQNFADFCFFWQGLILLILPFLVDVKPSLESEFDLLKGLKIYSWAYLLKSLPIFRNHLSYWMCKILVIANYFCRGHDL